VARVRRLASVTASVHPDSFGSYPKTSTDVSDWVITDHPNLSAQPGVGTLGCGLEDSAIRFPDPHLSRDNASIDEVVQAHGVDLRPLAVTIAVAHHRDAKAAVASPAECIGRRLIEAVTRAECHGPLSQQLLDRRVPAELGSDAGKERGSISHASLMTVIGNEPVRQVWSTLSIRCLQRPLPQDGVAINQRLVEVDQDQAAQGIILGAGADRSGLR
jgi:hypothetical protein